MDFIHDEVREVAETCILAIKRINQAKDIEEGRVNDPCGTGVQYFSIDPAFPLGESKDVNLLGMIAADEGLDLYVRYSAMFQLRNINTRESVLALTKSR